jgi:deazaflavin-dependent oxidoreductase (nitroreductase family)
MSNQDFVKALSSTNEISITVTGRKSGKNVSLPVWFVLSEDKTRLYLMPVRGSKTNWYRNLQKNPSLRISAGRKEIAATGKPVSDARRIADVRTRFTERYGAEDVKRYYSVFDACVFVDLK